MKPTRMTRLLRLEALDPDTRWEHTTGLSALLEAAKRLPQRDPWDLPDLEGGGSMGRLLAEARRRRASEDI